MNCPHCELVLPNGVTRCRRCGHKIVTAPNAPTPVAPPPAQPPPPPSNPPLDAAALADGVTLRYTDKFRSNTKWQLIGGMFVIPLGSGVISVSSGEDTFLVGLVIGIILFVLAVIWTLVVLSRIHKVKICGTYLVHNGTQTDLSTIDRVRLTMPLPHGTKARLFLRLGSLKLLIGDARMPCYLEPSSLRTLAEALRGSPYPHVHAVADRLRLLADEPRRESWPPLEWTDRLAGWASSRHTRDDRVRE